MNRRFAKDNPLRYLHVPSDQREDEDTGPTSDALDIATEDDTDFDWDEVRAT